MRRWTIAIALAVTVVGGCEGADAPDSGVLAAARPDARLRTHVVEPSTPTPAGLAYIRAVAEVHARADATGGAGPRAVVLREGLALPVPAGLGEAEVLRLELAAALCETLLETREGAPVARDVLAPMLAPDRSVPLDRATARAMVALGDAAVKTGDDALAAGSYARAIKVMSLLRQELEP